MIVNKKRFKVISSIWIILLMIVLPFIISLDESIFAGKIERYSYILSQCVFLLIILIMIEHFILILTLKRIDNFKPLRPVKNKLIYCLYWLAWIVSYLEIYIKKSPSFVLPLVQYYITVRRNSYNGNKYMLANNKLFNKEEVINLKNEKYNQQLKLELENGEVLKINTRKDIIDRIIKEIEIIKGEVKDYD